MTELRNTYFSIQQRHSGMKGSYKSIADRVGRTKSWMSMFARQQIQDVGILLLADIEEAMNEMDTSMIKKTNCTSQTADDTSNGVTQGDVSPVCPEMYSFTASGCSTEAIDFDVGCLLIKLVSHIHTMNGNRCSRNRERKQILHPCPLHLYLYGCTC